MPGWREQYDRMKRWHARIENATVADAEHLDNVHAFFINCFHFKDWLKADLTVDVALRKAAEDLVNTNVFLALCANLANGSKHMVLDRSVRTGAGLVLASWPASRVEYVPTVQTADGRVLFPASAVA